MKNPKRILSILLLGALLFVSACAGSDASKVDLKEPKQKGRTIPSNYEVRVPDSLTVYQNIDGHPTIAKLCIEGLAFRTTSRDYESAERVPEWDKTCPSGEK